MVYLKIFMLVLRKIVNRNIGNLVGLRKELIALNRMSTTSEKKNLCFTKYDQDKLKIIDIGANLSGH